MTNDRNDRNDRNDAQRRVLDAPDYEEFRRRLGAFDCRLCGLAATRQHLVVDRGTPGASILLIGEAPGADEDRVGQAFVGRSGRLLDSVLTQAGIDPATDILIANVAKCRPPDNRAPKRDEVAACLPYLLRQIELAAPRCVVLLGATAIRHVLPEMRGAKVTEVAGTLFENERFPGVSFLVTFHPAYVLRSRSKEPTMVGHFEALDSITETNP